MFIFTVCDHFMVRIIKILHFLVLLVPLLNASIHYYVVTIREENCERLNKMKKMPIASVRVNK